MPATIFRFFSIGLLLVATGCRNDKPAPQQDKKSTGTQGSTQSQTESPCEGTLATIDEVFKLSKLGRTTTIEDGVLRLNDWQRTCAPSESPAPLPLEIAKLLSEPQLKFLDENRFLQRDGEHLRNCLLDRAVSRYATGTGATELDRVKSLFEHVVRAIGLVAEPPQKLPLSPYEVYLLGKGTADDRAWVYINVLKQLRIDAVLIQPQSSDRQTPAAAGAAFLVGVLLEGQIFLFDPKVGVAIPSIEGAAAGGTGPRVATLAEAASDPAVLKQLDAGPDHIYPIAADELKHPGAAIVADPAFWSRRMQGLQTQFVGARAMVIADPPGDSADGAPGLHSRIAKAGGDFWNASEIRIWGMPEERLAAHAQMTKDQLELLAGLMSPFAAYKIVGINAEGQAGLVESEKHEDIAADKNLYPSARMNERVIERTTAGAQMQARIDQLEGNSAQAVRAYLEVREKCRELLKYNIVIPERIRHTRAAEDATYWTALCQYEQGEMKSAVNTLQYLRKRSESTHWQRESRYLLALSQAGAGDFKAAVATLETAEPDDPEYLGNRHLIRQWQAAAKSNAN
ncbi:MAG: CDC27 family protein [Planctomycetia bacterium]|nr:CDC27 family protein [Planctomycetia bacterium]